MIWLAYGLNVVNNLAIVALCAYVFCYILVICVDDDRLQKANIERQTASKKLLKSIIVLTIIITMIPDLEVLKELLIKGV